MSDSVIGSSALGLNLVSVRSQLVAWRRKVAQQLDWPLGAENVCTEIEDRFPGWTVMYLLAHTGPKGPQPAGYYASKESPWWSEHTFAYGADVEELLKEILGD